MNSQETILCAGNRNSAENTKRSRQPYIIEIGDTINAAGQQLLIILTTAVLPSPTAFCTTQSAVASPATLTVGPGRSEAKLDVKAEVGVLDGLQTDEGARRGAEGGHHLRHQQHGGGVGRGAAVPGGAHVQAGVLRLHHVNGQRLLSRGKSRSEQRDTTAPNLDKDSPPTHRYHRKEPEIHWKLWNWKV